VSPGPVLIGVGGLYQEHLRDNYLFTHADAGIGEDLLKPYNRLHQLGLERGVEFSTFDRIGDLARADGFLFLDFPRLDHPPSRRALELDRPRSLAIIESPIIHPDNWKEEHHRLFSRIFTYLDPLVDGRRYWKLNYAHDLPAAIEATPAGRARLVTMIAGAKASAAPSSLYGERLAAIRWYEQHQPGDFDLHGIGWDPAAFPSYRGPVRAKRDTLRRYRFSLAYENVRDVPGYVTEKIFDSLLAGCVPVYRGADNITDLVPAGCFVDRRAFGSYQELHAHLAGMSPEAYARHQEAIVAFLGGPASAPFSIDRFSETIVGQCLAGVEEHRRARPAAARPATRAGPAGPVERPDRSTDPAQGERAPRISICIPTYNRAPLLAQAIDSALAQDYPHLEVVIGDNGSTDGTEALCRRHAADPRVRYYRNAANQGAANNIRALVRHHASGDYVLVLCDDDILRDPAYLSKAAAILRAHRDDQPMLVFSNAVVWSEARQAVISASNFRVPEFLPGQELFEKWWTSFGGDTVYVPFLTAIFHRQTAADLFVFDEDVMAGDTMLWWKLLLAGNAGFVDTQAAVYRLHAGNDSTTASLLRHLPNLRMFVEPARLAVEAGYDLGWIRAWKHRMASAFISTVGPPAVRQAFLDSQVHTDLMALYQRAHQEGLPAAAERVEEDGILERARAFLTARADADPAPAGTRPGRPPAPSSGPARSGRPGPPPPPGAPG
jgi:hypothetical protein